MAVDIAGAGVGAVVVVVVVAAVVVVTVAAVVTVVGSKYAMEVTMADCLQ